MTTGTVVVRRSLGRRLKQLRNDARKTVGDVVTAGICSKAKLARIESGQTAVRVPDVQALCLLYRTDEETMDALVAMARNTSQVGWWEDYHDVIPPAFATYVELEAAADGMQAFEALLVPGLLQTPDYTRAVATAHGLEPDAVERIVELRRQRQRAALDRPAPVRLAIVMDAAVLTREVGSSAVMAAQCAHLLRVAGEDHVELAVLPWTAGAHAAMQGAFTVLQFVNADHPDVVYLETRAGGRLITRDESLTDYHEMFAAIRQQAQRIEEYLQ